MKLHFYLLLLMLLLSCDKQKGELLINKDVVEVEGGNLLFISAKSWGLAGNHEEITISLDSIVELPSDNKQHYIFYTDEIYYCVQNKRLKVFAPKSSINIPNNFKLKQYIDVSGIDNSGELKDYRLNYKTKGLKKISVFLHKY